jgi:hypothetical protein
VAVSLWQTNQGEIRDPTEQDCDSGGNRDLKIFRTEEYSPTDEFKKKIGELVIMVVQPWIFEIIALEEDPENKLRFVMTCRITGKVTEAGKSILIKEDKKDE